MTSYQTVKKKVRRKKMIDINEKSFCSQLSQIFKTNGMGALLNSEKSEKFIALTRRMLEETKNTISRQLPSRKRLF